MIQSLEIRYASQGSLFNEDRLIVWFSCGAASAVALKLLAHLKPTAVYCNLQSDEHPDNARFRADIERWTGIKIEVIASQKYATIEEVWEGERYMSGPKGARCTVEMKKVPRFQFQQASDVHIFGFTAEETKRAALFSQNNFDLNLAWPLLQEKITKTDCFRMIKDAGISLPIMYELGFEHNNCIGCVKSASKSYWNKVRKHFPEIFQRRAEQSRRLNCRLVLNNGIRIFLDELLPNEDDNLIEDLSCGPQCAPQLRD
jgi:hypothetical protein